MNTETLHYLTSWPTTTWQRPCCMPTLCTCKDMALMQWPLLVLLLTQAKLGPFLDVLYLFMVRVLLCLCMISTPLLAIQDTAHQPFSPRLGSYHSDFCLDRSRRLFCSLRNGRNHGQRMSPIVDLWCLWNHFTTWITRLRRSHQSRSSTSHAIIPHLSSQTQPRAEGKPGLKKGGVASSTPDLTGWVTIRKVGWAWPGAPLGLE